MPRNASKKSKSKAKQEDKQWEDWKKKDDAYVNENFEQDLQNAIVQSKLDFENQKSNSVSVIVTTQDKNKKKKSKTMSLDQFLEDKKKPEPNKGMYELILCAIGVFFTNQFRGRRALFYRCTTPRKVM